jgi:uncharacterized protein
MTTTTANPVVHFEILGRDANALRAFYGTVFGWSPSPPGGGPMEYSMIHYEGGGIDGGIGRAPEGPGHAIFYVGVADLQGTLDQIERLGGRTVHPPTQIPGGVSFAVFADPEGHRVGLVKE